MSRGEARPAPARWRLSISDTVDRSNLWYYYLAPVECQNQKFSEFSYFTSLLFTSIALLLKIDLWTRLDIVIFYISRVSQYLRSNLRTRACDLWIWKYWHDLHRHTSSLFYPQYFKEWLGKHHITIELVILCFVLIKGLVWTIRCCQLTHVF